jgi:hypothetical protein
LFSLRFSLSEVGGENVRPLRIAMKREA